MQRYQSLTVFTKLAACAVLALGMAVSAHAADKANVDGAWSWSTPGRDGGEPRKTTLTLKAEGEKLTGKIASPGRQGGEPRTTDISDGKIKGDEISFNVVREFQGNKMTQKFTGKVAGDTITGKMSFQRGDGEERSRDWEAKREKK